MSEESQRSFISGRLISRMKVFDPTLKIAVPNLAFDPPESEVYGRMYLMGGKSLNVAKSGEASLVRRTAMFQVTFFSPAESGTKRASEAIDEIIRIFENYRGRDPEGVQYTFKAAETRYPDQAGGWHQSLVRIPYFRDEYRALPNII
jgi:hypothetical protein